MFSVCYIFQDLSRGPSPDQDSGTYTHRHLHAFTNQHNHRCPSFGSSGHVFSVLLVFLTCEPKIERLLDLTHSSFVCASLVYYFLTNFGNRDKIDHIPWLVPSMLMDD